MNDVAFFGSIYGLGIIGLFGVTLLPLRIARLLWQHKALLRSHGFGKTLYLLVVLVAAVTLACASVCAFRVAGCLLGHPCTGDRAGGWFFLMGVGVFYAAFEVFAFVSFFSARKLGLLAAT